METDRYSTGTSLSSAPNIGVTVGFAREASSSQFFVSTFQTAPVLLAAGPATESAFERKIVRKGLIVLG